MAAVTLESIRRDGWICGVPSGVETPGLMTGLAGIGYGLLRLANQAHALGPGASKPPRGAVGQGTSRSREGKTRANPVRMPRTIYIKSNKPAAFVHGPGQRRLQYGLGQPPANRAEMDAVTHHHERRAAAVRFAGGSIRLCYVS